MEKMDSLHQAMLFLVLILFLSRCFANSPDFSQSTPPPDHCTQPAKCEQLVNTSCLGATLPYQWTSSALANDSANQIQAREQLQKWSGLQNAPKCWEVVQRLLCAVYFPNCTQQADGTGRLQLPSRELCDITRGPCKVVEDYHGWPDFLKCDQPHFKEGCSASTQKIKFNTTGQCERPLVATENHNSWYKDVEGCGIQCQNPLFTEDEHTQIHAFVGLFASVCLLCTLFAVLTFLIDWRNANRYPALILFFINACFFVGCIGWLAQFIPGARQDIVCRSDGTVRRAEPQIKSGETASCSIVFVLVYYSMMAGVTWFAILAYSWHLTFRSLGTPRDAIEGRRGQFHLIAWCGPLVLTIACLALSQIDGDSVSGICFIGYMKHVYRGGFVLAPIGVVIICGLVFLTKGMVTLIKIHKDTPDFISQRATTKIRDTIIRIGVFAGLALVFTIITFVVHAYIFINEPEWERSFRDYVICEAKVKIHASVSGTTHDCTLASRPSLAAIMIHLLSFFGAGITMSSWVWNAATLDSWKRFLRKIFRMPNNKPVKLKRHKMIAQAFNKRHQLRNGHMSISFHSTHDDPLGMKFEMDSGTSQDMSSAWAAAIPRMMNRRGGLIYPTAGTQRRYSDSDIQSVKSFQAHTLTVESRRVSIESHVSMSEVEEQKPKKKKLLKKRSKNKVNPAAKTSAQNQRGHNRPKRYDFHRRSSWPRAESTMSSASDQSVLVSMDQFSSSEINLREEALLRGKRGSRGSVEKQKIKTSNTKTTYSMFTASSYIPQTVEMHDLDGMDSDDLGLESRSRTKQFGPQQPRRPYSKSQVSPAASGMIYLSPGMMGKCSGVVQKDKENTLYFQSHPNAVEIEDIDSENSSIITRYSESFQ